jgi:hypothetical protein
MRQEVSVNRVALMARAMPLVSSWAGRFAAWPRTSRYGDQDWGFFSVTNPKERNVA